MKTKKYMIPNQRRIIRKQSEDLHRFIEQFLKIRERGRRGRGSSPIRHDYSQSPAILSGRFSAERLILDSEINYSRRAKSLMIATSCNSVILPDTTHEPRDERLDRRIRLVPVRGLWEQGSSVVPSVHHRITVITQQFHPGFDSIATPFSRYRRSFRATRA